MITIPVVAFWVIGGAVGAVAGWLVRKVLKTNQRAAKLESRLDALERHN